MPDKVVTITEPTTSTIGLEVHLSRRAAGVSGVLVEIYVPGYRGHEAASFTLDELNAAGRTDVQNAVNAILTHAKTLMGF